jgi:DMSO/TMAO reductase YedYZ molybdopterin-dependent catalytic subunit
VSRLWLPRRHLAERLGLDRRSFLAGGVAGVGAVVGFGLGIAGCNSEGPKRAQPLLAAAERWNERLERALFRHRAMNVAPARALPAGARFPSYFVSRALPVWDEATLGPWSLEVGGLVRRPTRLSLEDLKNLSRTELRLEHFCVEGWSAVAVRTGVRVSELARLVDVSPDARYVDFQSFDDGYHESWDIESALHPQTLIVYGQDGHLLEPAYGAPARLYSPVKLGYKNTKYLTRVLFLAERNGGYWSDQGYEWYAGV